VPKTKSLVEFAAENPTHRGAKCWLCDLPERKEVEQAAARGISRGVIAKWLKEIGHKEANTGRLSNHLRNHVD